MSFKIIAIKPLKGCSSKYLKVLKVEELYYFHQDYKIFVENNIEKVIYTSSYPDNLYDKGKLKINISAVVGKNGSGKSTVVELLFRAINNIASNFKYEEGNPEKTILPDIKVLSKLKVEFYYKTDILYKVTVNGSNYEVISFLPKIENNIVNFTANSKPINNFSLRKLFYTEVINYSHYAYNSDFEGEWIEKLFHKNDSYQTPVVFNPMRNRGNSNINTENNLVKQRLLSNLISPLSKEDFNFRKIGDNLEATDIVFKLKDAKLKVLLYEKKDVWFGLSKFSNTYRDDLVRRLFKVIYNSEFDFNLTNFNPKIYNRARAYILYKLISITLKYDEYKKYFLRGKKEFNEKKLDRFFEKLSEDNSHITFKLKQTLNYLYFNKLNLENGQSISIEEISKIIENIRKDNPNYSIIELTPPPIFNSDIILRNSSQNSEIFFSSLSSGEKQLTYSVSSILYHLTNLNSVTDNKIQYSNVNIVLEEIELYFHPDLQRKYINYLLNSIQAISLKNIKSINITFITHSPFILSDIPSNNIMFLNVSQNEAIQEPKKKKTFGANIHDLLADNFFFDDGVYIGKFAETKISSVIDEINYHKTTEKSISDVRLAYLELFISMIDEHILKLKLAEMLSELTDDNKLYNNIIDKEIKYLQLQKKKNA